VNDRKRDIHDLIDQIENAGVTLSLENGELIASADEGVLTEKRVEAIRKHKAEILRAKFPLDEMETAFISEWKMTFGYQLTEIRDLMPLAELVGYLDTTRPPSPCNRLDATFDKLIALGQAECVNACQIRLRKGKR
jgi:hypothetical protein